MVPVGRHRPDPGDPPGAGAPDRGAGGGGAGPRRMIALDGRTALVTGGSRGIGRAAAVMLARAGADVAIGYRSRGAEAETVAGEMRALGRRAVAVGGDLADPAAADRMAAEVAKAFGRLDIFVANAGVWPADEVPLGSLPLRALARHHGRQSRRRLLLAPAPRSASWAPAGRSCSSPAPPASAARRVMPTTRPPRARSSRSPSRSPSNTRPDILVNCVAPGWVDTEMSRAGLRWRREGAHRGHDPAPPHPVGRGDRRADRLSLQRPREPRDGRGAERERRERAVRVNGAEGPR